MAQEKVKQIFTVNQANEVVSIEVIRETASRYYTGRAWETFWKTYVSKDDGAFHISRAAAVRWGVNNQREEIARLEANLSAARGELAAFEKRYGGDE